MDPKPQQGSGQNSYLIGFFNIPFVKGMDIPKGIGISERDEPSCEGGKSGKGISLALVLSASLTCSK